jgi:hypothetical protein
MNKKLLLIILLSIQMIGSNFVSCGNLLDSNKNPLNKNTQTTNNEFNIWEISPVQYYEENTINISKKDFYYSSIKKDINSISNNESNIQIIKPKAGYLYLFDRELIKIGRTLIIGGITIEVEASENIEGVDFFIDNNLIFSDYTLPYSRFYNQKILGRHIIKVESYGTDTFDETNVFILNFNQIESQIIVNEVMNDPLGDDTGNEWIELYNKGDDVNINGWTICTSNNEIIATLPDWIFPKETFLVIHFGEGIDDADFSSNETCGNGTYFVHLNHEVLDNTREEIAIYSGNPTEESIIDFFTYCYNNQYQPTSTHDHAISAKIWNEKEYFNPINVPKPIFNKVPTIIEGDSIGRDIYSSDTDTPQDWDILGGQHAYQPTKGRPNIDIFGFIDENISTIATSSKKDWTVMIYMAADNDLELIEYRKLNEIESKTGTDEHVNIVFQIDGLKSTKSAKIRTETVGDQITYWVERTSNPEQYGGTFRGFIYKDESTKELLWNISEILGEKDITGIVPSRLTKSKGKSVVKPKVSNTENAPSYIGEKNTGDPSTLIDFIDWTNKNAPADHYLLVLSSHGQGWKGFSIDETNRNDMLYMHELKTALDGGQISNFDIIGFDACLMAMIEVAYQIKDNGNIMIASEEFETHAGWPLADIICYLQQNIGISEDDLSKYIVETYDNYQKNDACRTLSAIKLDSSLNSLKDAVHVFAQNLFNGMEDWGDNEDTPFKTHHARQDNCQAEVSDELFFAEYYTDRNFIDLYHFAESIGSHEGIYSRYKDGFKEIMNLINETVIYEKHGEGHDPNTHGISIYFPRNENDTIWCTPCNGNRKEEYPFDYPNPSRVADSEDEWAIYATDDTIEWGKVPYDGNTPHPWSETPNLLFRIDTYWDEFVHRFYKPCADAGEDQTIHVDDCEDCVSITFNGLGSSSVDDDLQVHKYSWDFDATVDSNPGMDISVDDMDRNGVDDLDDEMDAEGPQATGEFCVGTYLVTLTVWDDHYLKNSFLTNNFPNQQWKTDQDQCIITVTCDADNTPPTVEITDPEDGDYVQSPVYFYGEAFDSESDITELSFLLEWPGGSYSSDPYNVDPPTPFVAFKLGPVNLDVSVEWYKMTIFAMDIFENVGSDFIIVYPEVENQDTTPPITTAIFDIESRTVTLTAVDPPHEDDPISGVCATYYFIDDGDVLEYFEPFMILEGSHDVTFWSVDCTDNVEDPNTETFG